VQYGSIDERNITYLYSSVPLIAPLGDGVQMSVAQLWDPRAQNFPFLIQFWLGFIIMFGVRG